MITQSPDIELKRDVISGDPPRAGRLGDALIALGLIVILIISISGRPSQGGVVAAALFAVIIGMIFRYPTLLQDGTVTEAGVAAASTMRISVLVVISIFALLTVKAGWDVGGLDALKIDSAWAWVLGAAFGGKAFQSFAETNSKNS